jgi:hypothetical protein
MPLDTRIALGVQPLQLADPLAQYSQFAQARAAGIQNALAEQQLATAKLTYDQNKAAQDFVSGVMSKAQENGADVTDPMDAAKQMLMHPNPMVQAMGKHLADAHQLIRSYDQQKAFEIANPPNPASTNISTAASAVKYVPPGLLGGPTQTAVPMPGAIGSGSFDVNALAPVATAAPVSNALAPATTSANALAPTGAPTLLTPEKLAADIDKGDRLYGSAPGWAKQRERMMKQYEQLVKPPTLHVVEGNLVGPDGKVIYQGENTAKQRLEFDQQKFDWEKANPGYEVKEVPQANGTIKLVGVNKRTNEAVPITMSGKELVSPNLAAQRLTFEQNKFAWEKANPGKTIKEVSQADGTTQFFAIDNRTGSATPVMMAGVPGAAPSGGDRGAIGVTGDRVGPATPLIGTKDKALTESQGNATAFGMRMKDSHAALKDLENKGVTNTGVIGGTVGGVVGLVPFVGDKLTAGVDNIYNVLPQVLGGYSPEQQKVLNGRINFVTALLRKESGAAISPSEFSTAEKLYFPRPGDDAAVVKQKQNARDLAIKAMKVQAGPGAKAIDELGVGGSASNDPLGIR